MAVLRRIGRVLSVAHRRGRVTNGALFLLGLAILALPAATSNGASADTLGGSLCATTATRSANVDTDCQTQGNHFETSLAVNPTNGSNLVGAAIEGTTSVIGGKPKLSLIVQPHISFDGGASWATIGVDYGSYDGSWDPSVAFDASGTAYLATTGAAGQQNPDIVVTRSSDGGRTWSPHVVVAAGAGVNGAGVYNDHPQIAAYGNGNLVLTWIRESFGGNGTLESAPVYDSVSHDGGLDWSPPADISGSSAQFCVGLQAPTACDQTFGNSVAVTGQGLAVVTFQDTYHEASDGSTNLGRNKYLAVTVDPSSGAITGGPFLIGQAFDGITEADWPVDFRGLPTLHDSQFNLDGNGNVAADPTSPTGGHLAVVWYDDRNAPHPVSADPYQAVTNSDIVVSQTFDGGRTWNPPTTISEPNDQFMPWAAYDKQGRLQVGFYDRSYDEANQQYGFTLATEQKPGSLNFNLTEVSSVLSDPTRDSSAARATTNSAFPNPAPGMGDYPAIAIGPLGAIAYWTDMRNITCSNGICRSRQDTFFAAAPGAS